jgi:hypothetical protein
MGVTPMNKKYPQSILNQVIQKNRKDFNDGLQTAFGVWVVLLVVIVLTNAGAGLAFIVGTLSGTALTQALFGKRTGMYIQTMSQQIKDNPELAIRIADVMQTENNPIPPLFGMGDQKEIVAFRKKLGEKFHDNS